MKNYLILTLFLLSFLSCTTTIKNINDDPVYYSGKEVIVTGKVSKIVNVPLTNYSFIELTDLTDDIVVLTTKEYDRNDSVKLNAGVVALNTENSENYSLNIIKNIEKILVNKYNVDKKGVELTADTISYYLINIMDALEATYFLIESE